MRFLLTLLLLCSFGRPGSGAVPPRALQEEQPGPGQDAPLPPAQDRPILMGISVQGAQRYTEGQLIAALGQRVGEPVDALRVASGIDLLWKAFHVRARVDFREVVGGVELQLFVTELPVDLEPRFAGNERIGRDRLLEWAQLEETSELFLHQAPRVRQRLLEGYHEKGYFFAEVRAVVRGEGDEEDTGPPDVIFDIKEGPRVRVRKIFVNGNESLPDTGALWWKDGLRNLARVQLKPEPRVRWWNPLDWINPFKWLRGKPFVMETLEADLLAMRSVYRDRGWLDAVVELEDYTFNEERTRVDLHITIDEGPRYTVGSVAIETFERVQDDEEDDGWAERPAEPVFSEEELLALCDLEPGGFFLQTDLQHDLGALRDHYGSHGYLSHFSLGPRASWAFLEPDMTFDTENHVVHVVYRLAQGQQRYIREVLFRGVRHTRDRVLRREVSVLPGQQADLEEIERSLHRLEATGFFHNPVSADHPPPSYRFRDNTGEADKVDLEYSMTEGRAADINFGGSISSDGGVSAFISLTVPNFDIGSPPRIGSIFSDIYYRDAFRGAGQSLQFAVSPGSEIDYFLLRFEEPDIFKRHFDPISFEFFYQVRDRLYRSHDERREEVTPTFGKRIGDRWRFTVGPTIQEVDVDDIEDDEPVPITLTESEGTSDLEGLIFTTRYQDLDRLGRPSKGFRLTWENSIYGDVFSGDEEFYKSDLRYTGYLPWGDKDDEVRPGWQLGLGAGVADSYGDTDFVIYPERFFLGGSRSLRGFRVRGVGPNGGTDYPLGGETYLRGSLEYHFPLKTTVQPGTYRKQELFQMRFFTDWGLLDPDAYALDMDEWRGSLGFGFGLQTPVAPFRFDFGFPVADGDGDEKRVFSFYFGF